MCKTNPNESQKITNDFKKNIWTTAIENGFLSQVVLIQRKVMAEEGHKSSEKKRNNLKDNHKGHNVGFLLILSGQKKLQYKGTWVLQADNSALYFKPRWLRSSSIACYNCKFKRNRKLILILLHQNWKIYKSIQIVISLVFWLLYCLDQEQLSMQRLYTTGHLTRPSVFWIVYLVFFSDNDFAMIINTNARFCQTFNTHNHEWNCAVMTYSKFEV